MTWVRDYDGKWVTTIDGERFAFDTRNIDEAKDRAASVRAQRAKTELETMDTGASVGPDGALRAPIVYLVAGVPDYVKVGHTMSLERRLTDLQHANPFHLWVAACRVFDSRPLAQEYERTALKRLSRWRAHGGTEWVRLTPASWSALSELFDDLEVEQYRMLRRVNRRTKQLTLRKD